jgi:hypothetical protein
MKISSKQALDLENKLNLSEYSKEWSELGDILYKWRLDPNYFEVEEISYKITLKQFEWINLNIIQDDEKNKKFTLNLT